MSDSPERFKAIRHLCEAIEFISPVDEADRVAVRLRIVRDRIHEADRIIDTMLRTASVKDDAA